MSRKRNEYIESSEESGDALSDSERYADAHDSRFSQLGPRASKRRKLDFERESDVSDVQEAELVENAAQSPKAGHDINDPMVAESRSQYADEDTAAQESLQRRKPTRLKLLTPAQLEASARRIRKTGVIYLSRIPPFMKPSTIKHLLTPYGTISRLFLTPEAPTTYSKRRKAGGNKKRSFIDGWVEFVSKKDAKEVAELLNGQIVGGKKGGWYHDDIWNIKYLRGFKWDDLMEQVAREEREREARLRAEISREGRERKAFLRNVELAKAGRGMERKRAVKEAKRTEDDTEVDLEAVSQEKTVATSEVRPRPKDGRKLERRFRQNEVKLKHTPEEVGADVQQPDTVKMVLSKIF